jgi:glycerol-3-phosphate dehydrogenase
VGGKITTYRRLAEQALKLLAPAFAHVGPPWTQNASLPGGDFAYDQRDKLARELLASLPALGAETADRLARTYGTVAREILAGAACKEDLGLHFGADLYEREVTHLMRNEWVTVADDVLWRRTKLGLRLTRTQRDRLDEWLRIRAAPGSAADGPC